MKLLVACLLVCIAAANAINIADVVHEEFKSFMVSGLYCKYESRTRDKLICVIQLAICHADNTLASIRQHKSMCNIPVWTARAGFNSKCAFNGQITMALQYA